MNHPPVALAATQLRLTTRGPEETITLGRQIGQAIHTNLFIALSGDLGAGKTTFVKGLAGGLGIPGVVTSPTFTLVNDYSTGRGSQSRRLAHMDVYRLDSSTPAELDGIGYGELLDDLNGGKTFGLLVLVVEWADRLGDLLPGERLDVTSAGDGNEPDVRTFTLTAWGESATELLQRLA